MVNALIKSPISAAAELFILTAENAISQKVTHSDDNFELALIDLDYDASCR